MQVLMSATPFLGAASALPCKICHHRPPPQMALCPGSNCNQSWPFSLLASQEPPFRVSPQRREDGLGCQPGWAQEEV